MVRHRLREATLLLLSLLPAGAAAQSDVAQEERGWIGIQVEGRSLPDGSMQVMIVRVDPDSPARRAGLRPFDIMLRLDGEEVSQETLRGLGERLRPGTAFEFTVLRENREHRMRVTAGRLPAPMRPAAMEELAARVDSVRGRILQVVDSLLADSTWALAPREMEAARRALDEEAEAIRQVMDRTRQVMRSMRFRGPPPRVDGPPARGRVTVGETRFDERRGPDGRRVRVRITVDDTDFGERRGPGGQRPPPGVRFRSPYLLGERFVAGAELEEMQPDARADAQETGKWLQVVRILEGSPAARAGLAPSDVIVRIGGEPVGDLREFRIRLRRLHLRGRPEMQVVRGDTTLVVVLPR